MSALVAVAAQACGTSRLGFINPQLYAMASEGVGFNDVTTGNNDIYNVGAYNAGVGYDMASGLGSPDGAAFLSGLCPAKLSATKSSFSAPSTNVALNGTAGVSVTLRDASSSPVANVTVGVSASAASGTLLINGATSSATGPGQASGTVTSTSTGAANFTVTSNTAGPVTVTISYDGTTLDTATINFSAARSTATPGRPTITRLTPLVAGFKLVVAPSSAGSSPITSYQYSVNGGVTWVSFSATTRSIGVTTLAKARTYAVIARARNVAGVSAPSAASRVTTLS